MVWISLAGLAACIRQMVHLTDPRMLAVIDGAEGKALLKKYPGANCFVTREDDHKDVAGLMIRGGPGS